MRELSLGAPPQRFPVWAIAVTVGSAIALLCGLVSKPELALAAGVGLGFAAVAIARPSVTVYAMAIAIPLSFMAYKLFGPESKISFEKPIGVVAVFALAAHMAMKRKPLERDKTTVYFLLFIVANIVSILAAKHAALSAGFVLILVMLFAFYLVVINVITDLDKFKFTYYAIMIGTLAASLIGIWESESGEHIFEVEYVGTLDWGGVERVWSTVGDANFLALILMSAIPVSYFCFLAERRLAVKILYLSTTAVLSMGVFVSLSRGGLLALLVTAVLIFVMNVRYRFTWVLTLAILTAVWFMIPEAVWTRFSSMGDFSDDASIYQRVHILQSGLWMFRDNLLFGVGTGNFSDIYMSYLSPLEGREPRDAHNSVLQIAAETGLLGLVSFMTLFIYSLKNCHLARRAVRALAPCEGRRWTTALADGLEVGLIAQMVSMCFISAIWVKSFWISIALSVCLKKIAQRRSFGSLSR